MNRTCQIIIMAAGRGQRMHSNLPKVLHRLGGVPLLTHILRTTEQLDADVFVVTGYQAEAVQAAHANFSVSWVVQAEQLGTAHAVAQVLPHLRPDLPILILNGDVPLIQAATLQSMVAKTNTQGGLGLLVFNYSDPTGLGRILRDEHNQVYGIVEEVDATPEQRTIDEAYTGTMVLRGADLTAWLSQVGRSNQSQEYYLTDLVPIALQNAAPVWSVAANEWAEVQGVNTRSQLADLEREYQYWQANHFMHQGVSFADPNRFDCRGQLQVGHDVFIDVDVITQGSVSLGDGCQIGPFCLLEDCEIGAGSVIAAYSHIQGAQIGDHAKIGPFARLRSGTVLGKHVHIGNFVETKQAVLGEGTKVMHHSYLGDTIIGSRVNIGAGTITCNFDGVHKHQTIIEDEAFIGSDTQLIAPVRVGAKATIAAGTTVSKDVPAQSLAISRVPQRHIDNWQPKSKRPVADS